MNGYLGIHNMNITNEIGTIDNNIDDNNNIDSTAFIWSIVCMLIIVGVCFFCFCFLICSADNNRLHVPFPGETDEAEEERRQNRRALILANVIHKKVEKTEEGEGISIPLEKGSGDDPTNNSSTINNHKLEICSGIGDQSPRNNESPPDSVASSSHHNNSRRQKRHKDMNNRSMRSIRRAMKVKTDSIITLYSPKICPICMESYHTGEEIAWSTNEDCPHAFHLDCIMGWLIDHSTCPMCRNEYIQPDVDESV